MAWISSIKTEYLPFNSALALAVNISAWPARGPAPQRTHSFT
jgi:hypothetical protein